MVRGKNVLREVGKFAEKKKILSMYKLPVRFFFFFNIYLFIWLCQALTASCGIFFWEKNPCVSGAVPSRSLWFEGHLYSIVPIFLILEPFASQCIIRLSVNKAQRR